MMTWRARPLAMITIWDWHGSLFVTEDETERRGRGTCLQWPGNDPLSQSWNICSREFQNGDGWTDRVTPSVTRESLESHMSLWEKMDALRRWRSVGPSGFHFEPFSSSKPAIIEPFSVSAPLLMLSLKPLEPLQLLLPCRSDRAQAGPGLGPNATLHLIRVRLDITI